jgi:LysR family hydrogen peroxide-inducible transcriptional activator
MNIQQLEYIVAVEEHQSFNKAAAAKYVSQPALSMMIQKLEEELKVKIFDRSRQPVLPTEIGKMVLGQARVVLAEIARLQEVTRQQREAIDGKLNLGIIPTLAPYLLPLFLSSFLKKYPGVHLNISEHTTETTIERLRKRQLDAGLLVTPLNHSFLIEIPLFYESFYVYSHEEQAKSYLLPEDINLSELWLLEEGHCLRSQILNLCELRKKYNSQLEFEAGSIDTLIKMVDHQSGMTIVPELATLTMSAAQKKRLRPFAPPVPVREVSLVTHRDFMKKKLVEALKAEVLGSLPEEVREKGEVNRVEIT